MSADSLPRNSAASDVDRHVEASLVVLLLMIPQLIGDTLMHVVPSAAYLLRLNLLLLVLIPDLLGRDIFSSAVKALLEYLLGKLIWHELSFEICNLLVILLTQQSLLL
jgi:hypothetical protein